jgi:acetoacetyl-CoA reductase
MTRGVIEGMRERAFGRIVNISSINGQKGQFGQANYSAAKAGLIGFTKAVAQENAAKGITVNAVAPGYIDTEMTEGLSQELKEKMIARTPLRRMGTAADVANAIKFLVSDEASFITGHVLDVNGGMYM